jgi:membrane protease YdiL (CAAX protease family)
MISALTLDRPSFYISSKLDENSIESRVSTCAQNSFTYSLFKGISVGVANLSALICLSNLLSYIPNIETTLANPERALEYMESNFTAEVIEAPILEEIVFRVLIQNFFHSLATKIVPDTDVEIFSSKLKLATLVSILATAALFGWAHITSGLGILHVILATISGITFGVLKEKYGLTASISAHMINNALVYALCQLA